MNYGDFPVPDKWGISGKDYYADASLVVKHMEYATQVTRKDSNLKSDKSYLLWTFEASWCQSQNDIM